MRLGSFLRAISRRAGRPDEDELKAARTALRAFRREVHALGKDVARAHRELRETEHQVEQLLVLWREDQHAAEQLERLAPVMRVEAAERHAREAIARAVRVDLPVPHVVVAPLLPAAIYEGLLEAIPPSVFFTWRRSGYRELRVPPDLAPLHTVATWRFFARLVKHAIAPALLDAFANRLSGRPEPRKGLAGRLVRREVGCEDRGPAQTRRPVLRMVLALAREGGEDEYGSRLTSTAADSGVVVPFRANTALAFVNGPAVHAYASFPVGAPGGDVRYCYELEIGAENAAPRRSSVNAPDAARPSGEAALTASTQDR